MSTRAAALAYAAFVGGNWTAAAAYIEKARAAGYGQVLQLQIYSGLVSYRLERYEEALASLEEAYSAAQGAIGEHAISILVRLHLLVGDAERAWKLLLDLCPTGVFGPPLYSLPHWRGEPLEGKHVAVWGTGCGDDILYVRYLPRLAALGAKVSLNCRPRMVPLFSSLAGVSQVLPLDEEIQDADHQIILAELPGLFGAHLEENKWPGPYLFAEPRSLDCTELRVGLTWGGDTTHVEGVDRTAALAQMEPLASVAGVRLFSLQFGPHAAQLTPPPAGMEVEDISGNDRHFGDAAASIAAMDLVITVDTSIANLAGAMGVPVWIGLPRIPDWRWTLTGERTPWFPTARLYRQEKAGDWPAVFTRMAADLRDLASNFATSRG